MKNYPTLFDRLNKTFALLFSKVGIILMVNIVYNLIFIVGIKTLFISYLINFSQYITPETNFLDILYNPAMLYVIFVGVIFGITIMFLSVFLVIWNIKTFQQIYHEKSVNFLENITYAKNNYFLVFKTYWFLFRYIFLIPSILFIVGGLMFIGERFFDQSFSSFLLPIGGFLMVIAFVWFMVNAIYRTYRAIFALQHAVSESKFTNENFEESLKYTQGKYWRIFGNILFLGIMFQVILGIFNFIMGLIYPSFISSFDIQSDVTLYNVVQGLILNFDWIQQLSGDVLSSILTTILGIIAMIFSYLFYKDLQKEYLDSQVQSSDIVV